MLTGLLPAYVDRFARAWHRLSTTDTRRFIQYYISVLNVVKHKYIILF